MGAPNETGDSLIYAFPPRIQFAEDGLVTIPSGALPSVHGTRRWDRPAPDSLTLFLDWQRRYAGLRGALVADGVEWAGELRTTSHTTGVRRYTRTIRLSPVRCSSAPPVPEGAARTLPRMIELRDGRSFVVGDSAVDLDDGRVSLELGSQDAAGSYVGASRLLLRVRNGRIVMARIFFDDPEHLRAARERLFAPGDVGDGLWSRKTRFGHLTHFEGTKHMTLVPAPSLISGGAS